MTVPDEVRILLENNFEECSYSTSLLLMILIASKGWKWGLKISIIGQLIDSWSLLLMPLLHVSTLVIWQWASAWGTGRCKCRKTVRRGRDTRLGTVSGGREDMEFKELLKKVKWLSQFLGRLFCGWPKELIKSVRWRLWTNRVRSLFRVWIVTRSPVMVVYKLLTQKMIKAKHIRDGELIYI